MAVNQNQKKKEQNVKIVEYLRKVGIEALNNYKYRWGIDIFEKYRRHYVFNDNQLHNLGMLYDHLAMFYKYKRPRKDEVRKYLQKAKSIYQSILERNPKSHLALYGIGRVWNIGGNHKKGLPYLKKAYRLMQKLPRKERGTMAIGVWYAQAGNQKRAEYWYKKEHKDLNNFGTTINLFLFYKRTGKHDKALRYLLKAERLLKKEYEHKSKWSEYLSKELKEFRKIR